MQQVRKSHHKIERPPFECIALVLQGGGALGAFPGRRLPGAGGSQPRSRLGRRHFDRRDQRRLDRRQCAGGARRQATRVLEHVTTPVIVNMPDIVKTFWSGDMARGFLNQFNAWSALMRGAPHFFEPRPIPPYLHSPGTIEATSYYDTTALRGTLESLIDFDRINAGEMRFSVGAVNVRTGNFAYFDTKTHTIRPEHILASGALPPGFPPVEIEGELYWTAASSPTRRCNGWSRAAPPGHAGFPDRSLERAREAPHDMPEVMGRQKEIQYSSRTRAVPTSSRPFSAFGRRSRTCSRSSLPRSSREKTSSFCARSPIARSTRSCS